MSAYALAMTGDVPGVRSLAGLRAVLYTRVSLDRSGRQRSPEEQEDSGRRDCERYGLVVAAVLRDVLGASEFTQSARARGDFARLREMLLTGGVDVVVAWSLDRVTRNKAEWADIETLCRAHGVLFLLDGRPYDLDNPEDSYELGHRMLLAAREVAIMRGRVMRAMSANAVAGLPHGAVGWGYVRHYSRTGHYVGQEPDPEIAPVVRECFRRVAQGESLRSITRDLDGRGIAPPSGEACAPDCDVQVRGRIHRHRTGTWGEEGRVKLRTVLLSRTYLGERWHRGVLTKADAWPALVERELFDRVTAMLVNPKRNGGPGSATVRHLASGVVSCAKCGGGLTWKSKRGGHHSPYYTCRVGSHVSMNADVLEERLVAVVIDRLRDPALLDAWSSGSRDELQAAHAEIAELQAQLDDAEAIWMAGKLSAAAYGRMEAELAPKIAALTAQARELSEAVPHVVTQLAGEDAAQRWEDTPLVARRSALVLLFPTIRLLPADRSDSRRLVLVHPNGKESRV